MNEYCALANNNFSFCLLHLQNIQFLYSSLQKKTIPRTKNSLYLRKYIYKLNFTSNFEFNLFRGNLDSIPFQLKIIINPISHNYSCTHKESILGVRLRSFRFFGYVIEERKIRNTCFLFFPVFIFLGENCVQS